MTKARTRKQQSYDRGLWAEHVAAFYLFLKGYRILRRRYKTPVGEIDLVAVRKKTLAMVEVKAREKAEDGLCAVNVRSQGRIARAAGYFLAAHPSYAEYNIRFDVVVYAWPFSLRHLDNAWLGRS